MPGHQVESRSGAARAAPVQPFQLFKKSMLPKTVKVAFENHWVPIMKIMTAVLSLNMNLNEGEFEDAFQLALDYVKHSNSLMYLLNHGPSHLNG